MKLCPLQKPVLEGPSQVFVGSRELNFENQKTPAAEIKRTTRGPEWGSQKSPQEKRAMLNARKLWGGGGSATKQDHGVMVPRFGTAAVISQVGTDSRWRGRGSIGGS